MNNFMKQYLLSILFLIVALPAAQAQKGPKLGLRFGPLVSFTTITSDNGNEIPGTTVSSKLGFSYGLMTTYGFTDNYGIYSGVHIVRKGFDRTTTTDSLTFSQDVVATTVEVPIALRGRSNEIGNGVYINGLFGLTLDVRAAYRNIYTGLSPTGELGSGTSKNTALINPITSSFLFGAGADWLIDRVGNFSFNIAFHRGLINLNNKRNTGNDETIRVSYLALDVAYLF